MLFEDNHLLVVVKPAGLPTQGDRTGDVSLLDVAKSWIKERHAKPGSVYLGLVHRLDRPAAGLVVLAKTSKAASRLSEQFREREVRKTYRAVVDGTPAATEAELVHYLGGAGAAGRAAPNRVTVRETAAPGYKVARLRYRALRAGSGRALLEIELETGRKHQIRAQLAAIGHPILGDRKYGGAPLPPPHPLARARGIALVAARLELKHPVRRGDVLVFELPPSLDPLGSLLGP